MQGLPHPTAGGADLRDHVAGQQKLFHPVQYLHHCGFHLRLRHRGAGLHVHPAGRSARYFVRFGHRAFGLYLYDDAAGGNELPAGAARGHRGRPRQLLPDPDAGREREVCEEVLIDIDLLCADKEMAFEYINAVSDAGLEILDITLNNYSICKEAVLLEQSLSENIILLDISDSHTYMSLLSKGKLVSTEVIYEGLGSIISEIRKTINIPLNDLTRLTVYNVNYESENPDDAVYAWKDEKNVSHSINIKELNDCANKPLKAYIERIMQMCTPILEKGKTKFIMTGQGSKMDALAKCLREASKAEVKQYYPDTIGIRDAQMCSVYGSFFAYKEKASLNNLNVSCVDIAEYDSTVDQKKIDVEGETITMKIKKLFEQYRDREEK